MKLHNIGKHLRSRAAKAGPEPYKLSGSSKLPTFVVAKPPRAPRITVAPMPVDARYDTSEAEEHFAAYLPGIDPSTGKPWGKR